MLYLTIDHSRPPIDTYEGLETEFDQNNKLGITDFTKAKAETKFIKNSGFTFDERKETPNSFISDKIASNQSKIPNKASIYFMNNSSCIPTKDKSKGYGLNSNHSFNVKSENVSFKTHFNRKYLLKENHQK